jgi:putative thioredoxin
MGYEAGMVIDVTEASFATEVLDRSRTVPVVVDFWAAWCGPCRTLGPILERAVEKRQGEVVLAKVDVDANPGLQMQFGIRGIPAVKAFKDGRVVGEFVGAQPGGMVERFLDSLVPSAAERLVAAGDEASLRQAIALEPDNAAARVALARALLDAGQDAEALALLTPVEHDSMAAALIAQLRLLETEDGTDSTLRAALTSLRAGDSEGALPVLVATVRDSVGERRDMVRRVVVGVFGELGENHPLTRRYRPELAAALY